MSEEWMLARKDVLTASEIRSLLPEFRRMLKKPANTLSPGFFAFCGDKLASGIPSTLSTGPAARGHIMEPYAIEDWNYNSPQYQYNHWDDLVIKRNGIGYSPDGLDIEQIPEMGVELWADNKTGKLVIPNTKHSFRAPKRAIEVKCYEPKQHMKSLIEDKTERDERLQAAVAFMVLPKLELIDVLWYCPEAPVPMFNEVYEREDLQAEIKVITSMLKMFHKHMDIVRSKKCSMMPTTTTQKIYEEYVLTERTGI